MFGKMVYFDESTINEYMSIISNKNNFKVDEYKVSKARSINLAPNGLGFKVDNKKEYNSKAAESLLLECIKFENLLSEREEFIDYSFYENEIETVSKGTIIKVDGFVSVPEEFDIVNLIDKFKYMLIDSKKEDDESTGDTEAQNMFLKNLSTPKIPIIIDIEGGVLCGKLIAENLLVEYQDLSELDDIEMTIIARCASSKMQQKEKPYYDPLRDFLKLNRRMRKEMNPVPKELAPLYIETKYKDVDILAIYR